MKFEAEKPPPGRRRQQDRSFHHRAELQSCPAEVVFPAQVTRGGIEGIKITVFGGSVNRGAGNAAPGQPSGCKPTLGQWSGCHGNGCSVCVEKVAGYPLYFGNHPLCSPNFSCDELYSTCNANCPEPTHADLCDTSPGDVNLDDDITIGDIATLDGFLICLNGLTSQQIANSDVNGDCAVGLDDVDYLVDYLFSEGPAPVPCVCTEPAVPTCRCTATGDVNLDSNVCTVGDIATLDGFLLCMYSLSAEQLIRAYVNADCLVNLADSEYLVEYLYNQGADPLDCACDGKKFSPCRCTATGDVNLDSNVCTVGDVALITGFLECSTELTSEQIIQADVDGNCVVNQDDVNYCTAYKFSSGPAPLPCLCVNKQVPDCE